jgi:hypothetical protein
MTRSAALCRVLNALLCVVACATPARAQARVYVTGDVFAEVIRLSRATVTPEPVNGTADLVTPQDGVTLGGGARIGAFFSPIWSLELGVDMGKAIRDERTRTFGFGSGLPVTVPSLQYRSRTSQRFTATSVLVGYHPVVRGRIQPGFRGGVSFMRTEREFTIASISTLTLTPILPPRVIVPGFSLVTNEYRTVSLGLAATAAAEAAIDLTDHLAVVAEMRALAGGLSGIVLRPGGAVRWRW